MLSTFVSLEIQKCEGEADLACEPFLTLCSTFDKQSLPASIYFLNSRWKRKVRISITGFHPSKTPEPAQGLKSQRIALYFLSTAERLGIFLSNSMQIINHQSHPSMP